MAAGWTQEAAILFPETKVSVKEKIEKVPLGPVEYNSWNRAAGLPCRNLARKIKNQKYEKLLTIIIMEGGVIFCLFSKSFTVKYSTVYNSTFCLPITKNRHD